MTPLSLNSAVLLAAAGAGLIALAVLLRRLPDFLKPGPSRSLFVRWLVPATDLLIALTATVVLVAIVARRADRTEALLGALILAALAWTFRATAEDFASGIVLRMEGLIDPGEWIGLDDTGGRIRAVGMRSLELETESGRRLRIPYTRIARSRIEQSVKGAGARAQTFRITMSRAVPLARILEEIPRYALLSPWSSAARPPEVRLVGETPTEFVLEVTVYAVDPAFVSEIEAAVRLGLNAHGSVLPGA